MAYALCTRYYGTSPEEIERMPLETFNDYLREIPAVERILSGRKPDGEEGETPSAAPAPGRTAKELFKEFGIEVPN